jgi:hypothetical protein
LISPQPTPHELKAISLKANRQTKLKLGGWRAGRLPEQSGPYPRCTSRRCAFEATMAREIEPLPLAFIEQLKHLGDVIESARLHAEEAIQCHRSACLKLDAAQYALTALFKELSTVMDITLGRPSATVHALTPEPERSDNEAIAA